MSTINKFEDLEVWQNARLLSREIYALTDSSSFSKDFALKSQILRSCGSIMDNIAEGFERDGKKEFLQYLSIAKGSAGELRSQLYRALDNNYINEEQFNSLFNECSSISKMITSLMNYLKNSDLNGIKYKKPQT
jgi:four helix bundle protein